MRNLPAIALILGLVFGLAGAAKATAQLFTGSCDTFINFVRDDDASPWVPIDKQCNDTGCGTSCSDNTYNGWTYCYCPGEIDAGCDAGIKMTPTVTATCIEVSGFPCTSPEICHWETVSQDGDNCTAKCICNGSGLP